MAYVIMGECPIIWYFIVIRPIICRSGELWTVCASIYEADVEPLVESSQGYSGIFSCLGLWLFFFGVEYIIIALVDRIEVSDLDSTISFSIEGAVI